LSDRPAGADSFVRGEDDAIIAVPFPLPRDTRKQLGGVQVRGSSPRQALRHDPRLRAEVRTRVDRPADMHGAEVRRHEQRPAPRERIAQGEDVRGVRERDGLDHSKARASGEGEGMTREQVIAALDPYRDVTEAYRVFLASKAQDTEFAGFDPIFIPSGMFDF